jgi:hypothetical protein
MVPATIFWNMPKIMDSTRYNAYQLQTKYGVNRATIGRWKNAGNIVVDDDGYFDHNAFLVYFQQTKSWKIWKEKNAAEAANITAQLPLSIPNQLSGSSPTPPLPGFPATEGSAMEKMVSKADLTNQKLLEDVIEKRRKNAEAGGRVIDRQLLKRFVGRLGEIDNTEWRSLSSRVTDDVMAICGVSGPELLAKLTRRIDDEVFSILASGQRSQSDFLDSLPVETTI